MTSELWNKLTFFEQLSNIDGEVNRLIKSRSRYLSGQTNKDNSAQYLPKISNLIRLTFEDTKNKQYKLRKKNFMMR